MSGFVGGEVVLAGTTWTSVLAAPGASVQREVVRIYVWNRDTVLHTVKARKVKGGSSWELFPPLVLQADQRGSIAADGCVLDATDESIEMQSNAAATTTEPIVDVGAFEATA